MFYGGRINALALLYFAKIGSCMYAGLCGYGYGWEISYPRQACKNHKFFPPPHLAPSFGVTPLEFTEMLYGS